MEVRLALYNTEVSNKYSNSFKSSSTNLPEKIVDISFDKIAKNRQNRLGRYYGTANGANIALEEQSFAKKAILYLQKISSKQSKYEIYELCKNSNGDKSVLSENGNIISSTKKLQHIISYLKDLK